MILHRAAAVAAVSAGMNAPRWNSVAIIAVAFHSSAEHVRHAMDYLGAALLAGTLTSIVLFTSLGGTTWDWGSWQIVGLATYRSKTNQCSRSYRSGSR